MSVTEIAGLIELLVKAGLDLEPVVERLVGMKGDPTPDDVAFLKSQRALAEAKLFDTSKDI